MILILVPEITPRLSYTFHVIMELMLESSFRLTTYPDEFNDFQGAKFSYGINTTDSLRFNAVPLLFENDIRTLEITPVNWKGFRLFFPVENPSSLPFDPFAIIFYLISRYEEYLPDSKKDLHGRFDILSSIAFLHQFHRKPMANIIAMEIAEILKNQFPDIHFCKPESRILYTYDVDMAYQYKGKSTLRYLLSFGKALLTFDYKKMKGLKRAAFGESMDDEFDQFDNHFNYNKLREYKPIHFLLTAPFGKYDRNIDPGSRAFSELVKKLAEFSEIGIHPSYYSSEKAELLDREKAELESVLNQKIVKSRQHYLRFSFPSTFRNLIATGITDDYSVGWTTDVGFRSSTATPHPFYDLSREEATSLILHPLTIMDGALAGLTPNSEEQIRIFYQLLDDVKKYGGEFILLQHNSFPIKFDHLG